MGWAREPSRRLGFPGRYTADLNAANAESVASFLGTQNIAPARFTTYGYGQDYPVADNATEAGRAQNRRVEVAIWANDKLKKVAAEKTSS